MGVLYRCKCLITGEQYFGMTKKDLAYRKAKHMNKVREGSQSLFHRRLREYGPDAFIWEVLEEHPDPDLLRGLEYIHIFSAKESGIQLLNCVFEKECV